MALDWISRLFSSGSAKGLSGDTDSGLLDPSSYYAGRLRRHRTTGDVVEDPFLLWQTEGKHGLRAHLSAQKNQGSADFTDILVVVNRQDFERGSTSTEGAWGDAAGRVLGQELKRFQDEVGFEMLFAVFLQGKMPKRFEFFRTGRFGAISQRSEKGADLLGRTRHPALKGVLRIVRKSQK